MLRALVKELLKVLHAVSQRRRTHQQDAAANNTNLRPDRAPDLAIAAADQVKHVFHCRDRQLPLLENWLFLHEILKLSEIQLFIGIHLLRTANMS